MKIKGFIPQKKKQPTPTLSGSIDSVLTAVEDIKATKQNVERTLDTKIKEVDATVEGAMKVFGDKTKLMDSKVAEFEQTAISLIEDIHNIPQIQGLPGKDADASAIVKEVLEKIPAPEKLDEDKLVKKVLKAIPESKASLKVIRETLNIEPAELAKSIMALPIETFSLKQSQVQGLEQALRLIQINGKGGYVHGGGFNNIYSGGTLVSNGLTGLNFTGSGVASVTKNATTGIITVDISGGGGGISEVFGTVNRITVTNGTTTPTVDIASTYVGQTSITTLGTIGTGTWNATTIGVSKGGTGLTSISALSILVANSANTFVELTPSAGQSIRINAGGTAWEAYTPSSGGTPGGSDTQLQYNNAGAFGGISGATTNGTAVTFATDGLLASTMKAGTSAGILLESNSGTDVALLGAGGGAGATFYGGVNVAGDLAVDTNVLYVDTTNNRVGVGTASPTSFLEVAPTATLDGDSGTKNFFRVVGTFNATPSLAQFGARMSFTTAGSASFANSAFDVTLGAGYTGSALTRAFNTTNSVAGTGVAGFTSGAANYGLNSFATGVTAGHNVGGSYSASGSSSLNLGFRTAAISSSNSPALNVGTASLALNGTVNVAGFFGLQSTAPTLGTSAALIADNGATASDIFVARDNGTAVVTIADGGHLIANTDNSYDIGASGATRFRTAYLGTSLFSPLVVGSTAANGDITIEGTSSATKTSSYVILQPTSGNVGIGTTGPASKLHAVGSTGLSLENTSGGFFQQMYFSSGVPRLAYYGANPGLQIGYQTTLAGGGWAPTMTLTNTGNVGIGTTSPAAKLDVLGTTQQLRLSYTAAAYVGMTVDTNSVLDFHTMANHRGRFSNGQWFGTSYGASNLPTYSSLGDTNTGIHFSDSDVFGFMTGGTRRWEVNASGHLLAFADNTYDIGASGATRPRNLYVGTAGVFGGGVTFYSGLTPTLASYRDSSGVGWMSASTFAGGASTYQTSASHGFYTGGTLRGIITADGLGLGGTTPATGYVIDAAGQNIRITSTTQAYFRAVRGTTSHDAAMIFGTTSPATTDWLFGTLGASLSGNTGFHLYNSPASLAYLSIATDGKVGIGTNSPTLAKLQVVGSLLAEKLVEANTAGSGSPNIITSAESGTVFTNEGSAAQNYHTLPTAAAGLTYTFYVDDADGIRITANTGDIIQINGVASTVAGYASSVDIGSSVTLTAINNTDWVATSVVGTFTLA